tara:strand:+ start:23 stop:490 length:468 start_codon:yes stop_codon:yes gene_type:complete
MNVHDLINVKHSAMWTKFNDNTRAAQLRKIYVENNGGEFRHNGSWYQYFPPINKPKILPIPKKKNTNQKKKYQINPIDPFKSRISLSEGDVNTIKNSVANQKSLYIITDPEGNETEIENFSKFCRDHKLNKSAMYEVARGKRKHHKKYTCRKKEY